MSEWIRIAPGELWHRVSPLEYEEVPVNRSEFVLMCHERIPASGGWEQWVEELVPQDDQHVACLVRAKREAYWRDRFNAAPKQPMPWMVRDLALEAKPGLEKVVVDPYPLKQGERGVEAIKLRAGNLDIVIWGGGRTMAWAVAELLASVEADVWADGGPTS